MSTSLGGKRRNGQTEPSSGPRLAPAEPSAESERALALTTAPPGLNGDRVSLGPVTGWRRRLLGALAAGRWLAVVGFFLTAVASFSSYGSDAYRSGALHEPFMLVLATVAGLAAIAAWTRFNWDRSSQNLFLFAAFAGLAVLYVPYGLVTSGGPSETDLLTGPISRTIFGIGLLTAVAGVQAPALTRLPAWLVGALVVTAAVAADVALHSGILENIYVSNPGASLKRLEGVGFALNLAALAYVSRAWWRTRRPFLIYVIGTVSALMLGTTLFISTEAWDGRWWVAHLGIFVSAIVLGEGMVAETFRRGKLSEVMDLGGLSQLAESTVDTMRDGLALHDAEGQLVGWNPAAEKITGWSRETATVLLANDLPEGTVNLTGEKWVDVRHFTVHQNSYYYHATLFTDVTERREAEEALRESEERYRSLVEASPDAVLLTDLGGRILLCNRRAAALHGYETGEELMSKNSFNLIASEDRERAMADAMRIVQGGGVRDVQYRMVGEGRQLVPR